MPTKRTWREREIVAFPSAYCAAELLAGKISYPVRGYTGYGDGIGNVMRADWAVHREVLLAFWISGRYSSEYQALAVLLRRARDAAVGVVDARGPPANR
jgi:hypothetical protein